MCSRGRCDGVWSRESRMEIIHVYGGIPTGVIGN